MKDVSEKLRMAVAAAIEKWDDENQNCSNFLKYINNPNSQARNFFDDAVSPILAKLDELAEIKRLLTLAGQETCQVMEIGVINGMKLTLMVTPEEK